eukprot:Amastigsp_a677625_213.p4 type:complete len:102 gc:universal Amastigsp_a677625_213:227-532(+)
MGALSTTVIIRDMETKLMTVSNIGAKLNCGPSSVSWRSTLRSRTESAVRSSPVSSETTPTDVTPESIIFLKASAARADSETVTTSSGPDTKPSASIVLRMS